MPLEKDSDGFYTPAAPDASKDAKDVKDEAKPEDAAAKDAEQSITDLIKSDYDVLVTLADQQQDPNSPLYSVKAFEDLGLHEDLLKGIYDMKFTKPSKIQERALPLLLKDPAQNFIGQSQSGTGKTAAFVLTMLSRVDFSLQKPQALCLAPSRELARQIMTVVTAMGKFTPVQTEFAIKEFLPKDATNVTAQIIVGTPGTMNDLVRRRVIDTKHVKVFVLDEADQMLDQGGLGDQTTRLKNGLKGNKDVQYVLFSATFPEHVHRFAQNFAPNANLIQLKRNEISVDSIRQLYMDCQTEDKKYDVLVSLYKCLTIGQSIIFCMSRNTADEIARRMIADGHHVASLHGAKDAHERDNIIDRFRAGQDKVLITTNVIARGIDIPQVNMVVNYDLPLMMDRSDQRHKQDAKVDVETYIHRIGRTGRFGRKGIAVNFVHNEKTWNQVQAIEAETHRPIPCIKSDDVDEMEESLKKLLKN